MFGYITPVRNKLEENDIETYRKYYCGLCHDLKRYGGFATHALSYDAVFLALLLSDLYDEPANEGKEKCMFRPVKEHAYISNRYTEYASAMQIILMYFKALDDEADEGKKSSYFEKTEKIIPRIRKSYGRQFSAFEGNMKILNRMEKEGEKNANKLSLTFSAALSEMFVYDENDFFADTLRLLGSSLARFIYIMDAYNDRKSDEKKGLFNPLKDESEAVILDMLLDAAASSAEYFERLPLDENINILRNIIYSGMWKNYDRVKKNDR